LQSGLYELSQRLLGAARSDERLGRLLATMPEPAVVVDVGGGTGISEPLLPKGCTYVCLDLAHDRLRHFLTARPARSAVQADAGRLPFAAGSVDLLLCRGVFHHLDDRVFDGLLAEARRVLGRRGALVWLEPVWSRTWWPGRVLWMGDAGSHPRESGILRGRIEAGFTIDDWDEYAIYHRYAIGAGRPRALGDG
jgi:ubiquinone/menaquinone biosynthesis C-methylase UbiE